MMKTKQQKLDKLMEAMSDKRYRKTERYMTYPWTPKKYKINKPVYLHNVLMWAEKQGYKYLYWWKIVIVSNISEDNEFVSENIPRDLSKDLYWQSDETINKLFELLHTK